jgi:hypothetical protein
MIEILIELSFQIFMILFDLNDLEVYKVLEGLWGELIIEGD